MLPAPPTAHDALRSAAAHVAAVRGLDLVVLFGSTATGSRPMPDDLDIAVRARTGIVDAVALTNDFIAALGRQDVDLVDLRTADPVLLAAVARDGVPLFEADPATFTRFTSLAARRFADTRKFREAARETIRDFIPRSTGAQ